MAGTTNCACDSGNQRGGDSGRDRWRFDDVSLGQTSQLLGWTLPWKQSLRRQKQEQSYDGRQSVVAQFAGGMLLGGDRQTKLLFEGEVLAHCFQDSGSLKGPALIAVAHTLLQLVFQVLSTGKPYVERGLPPLDGRQKNRMIRHHVRRLGKLGIAIHSMQAAGTAALGRPLKAVLLEPRLQATS
jgi:hypothetical protein